MAEKTYTEAEFLELKGKLNEFRDTNVGLLKAAEKFKGIDLEKYGSALEAQKKLDDKKLLDAGKVDELVANGVKAAQEQHAKAYSELEHQNSTHKAQLEALLIDGAVKDSAIKAGVLPGAISDVVLRAKAIFKLEDGAPKAFDVAGNALVKAGSTDPLSMGDWMKGLEKSATHLFTPSNGSGSSHNSSGQRGSKEVTRTQFDERDQGSRATFAKDGGSVVDG